MSDRTKERLLDEMKHAESKAIEALSRYKFQMFGYWAGIWVHLNRLSGARQRNPFNGFVHLAREKVGPVKSE